MKRSSLVVFSLIVVGLAGAALAATSGPKPDETGGAHSMTPTANGVVRLDTQTGAMSLCTGTVGQWSCQDMNDSSATSRLRSTGFAQRTNRCATSSTTSTRNLGLNDNNPDVPPKPKLALPSEQDVDRAFDYLEAMAKKIHERLDRLQEQQDRPGKAL